MKKMKLVPDEAMLENEIENGLWNPAADMENEISRYELAAKNTLRKNRKINIRISDWDYNKMKIKAVQEGIPYQTLISSLIHKFLTGQLKSA